MHHRIVIVIGIISLWAACGLCPAISVSTSPFPKTVLSGQAAPIAINLDTATQFRGCMIRIAYDTDLLSYVSASRGPLWTGYNIGWWRAFNGAPNETPGVLRIECVIFGAGVFATGPGNLFNINFNALSEGYSELNILEVKLYHPLDGTPLPGVTGSNGAVIIGPNPAYAFAKCWLQGPYLDAVMSTELNSQIPHSSPYPLDPLTVDAIPEDIVDWIWVELRNSLNGPAVKASAMWLHSDGRLTSPGKPFMLFMNAAVQPYYVVIKHRNHLSLTSNGPVNLVSTGSPPLLDFRYAVNVYPNGSVNTIGEYCAMKSGDGNQDGFINNLDRNNHWRLQAGSQGYLSADFDLDGKVLPSDLNLGWRQNSRTLRQMQTDRGGIEFSIANPAIIELGSDAYLDFKIEVKGMQSPEFLGTGVVLLDYSGLAFGENVCGMAAVNVSPGALINATFPVYQLIINDYEPECLAITYEFTGLQTAGVEIPTIPGELLHVRMKIANLDQDSGLVFRNTDMQDQQFMADNATIFNPVTIPNIAGIYLPSSPVNLSMSVLGSVLVLAWQPVAGCTYTVYGSDNPSGNNWQIEATGLTAASWTQALGLSRYFYYVSARASVRGMDLPNFTASNGKNDK